MAVHHGDIKVIEKALTDYKLKAQEMNVGVNYMALDDERRRQELLLRELREIEEEITSPSLRNSKLPNLASVVGTELSHNSKCLQYLAGISELERSIGDVTTHFTERSVELSDPGALSKDVVTFKTLSENVKSCWSYVDQLTTLAQIHLKASAEYHQFFHEANEIETKLEKQLTNAQKALKSATDRRSHKEASKMATEINEQLNAMRSLWKRSMKLVERSETIIPIRIRMGGVAKGMAIGDPSNRPVMVRALVSLTGPDYKIQKGEILRLMDNRQDSHLWSVRTSTGTVEVPGVCLWLMNCDTEAVDRAISIKQKCKKTWLEIINLIRLRLYEVYYDLMEQFNSQEVICSHEEALNSLFGDIQNLLITPIGQDGRLKSNLNTFRQKVIIAKRLERLQSGDINLRESEIVQIRSPLLRLHDHIIAADQMQQDMKKINDHITEYLSQVENERRQIESNLDQLNRMNRTSEQQLKDMMRKMDKMREKIPYTKPTARIKVEPLLEVREELPRQKRSRSQPRMSVLNAISSSSSSDSETSADHYVRNGVGRRAKSHIAKADAMVQIGYQNRAAEAQYLNGQIGVRKAHPQSDKSVQIVPVAPLQLSAQTQMGYSVNTRAVQVDASTMEAYNMEVKKNTRSRTMPTSSEDDYISQVVAGGLQTAPVEENRKKQRTRRSPSEKIHVHSLTQIGIATSDKASSPVREIDRAQTCTMCQRRNLLVSQTQVGPLYSGSERYQDYPLHDVKSENGPHKRVNKKVQSGYPCLTDRANLYCQCDVFGPERMIEEMETESAIYQNPISARQPKKMDTFAQVGVLYSNARQQAQVPLTDTISSSTQVGMLYESPKRRIGHAQFQQRSSTDLSSASNTIEAIQTEKERYVTNVALESFEPNSTIQVDAPLMRTSVQAQGMKKEYSDSNVQVGKIRSQNRYAELSVENKLEPIVIDKQQSQYALPPKEVPTGISLQVGREQYDEITQISSILTHDEVQTREPNLRIHDLQVYDSSILRPKRSTSVPSVQYSSETQVGPMVIHESLSPIGAFVETVKATEVLNVQAMTKSTKHKRIQSSCVPSSRNVEMQIGQLVQESATQSVVENNDITHISPTILAVQQKAISLPNLFVAETQVQPNVRGKKLQVSISMEEPTLEKKHKKLQVSVDTMKEMYDVQVATLPIEQKERFDVSCDTQIQPPKIAKKVQVSLMDLPDIPMVANAPLVYSMPPVDMKDTPAVSDAVCEPMASTQYYDAQCQCQTLTQAPTPVKVEMVNAGLQVSSAPPLVVAEPLKPECRDTYTQSDKVAGIGKKLQVAIEFERPIYEITTQQTYFEDIISIQQPTIMQPVYSAPPQPKVETKDRACEPPSPSIAFDASVQAAEIEEPSRDIVFKKIQVSLPGFDESVQTEKVDKPKTVVLGKKLQVTPTALSFESVQTIFIEPVKIAVEKENLVYSAPPIMAPPKVQTDDKECDALEILQAFDASVQVASSHEKPRPTVAGKKLQVSPEPLALISSLGDCRQIPVLEIAKTQSTQAPVEPQIIQVQEVTRAYAALPQTVSTEDKICDAVQHIDNFDASVQAAEAKEIKPMMVGKKLQVSPISLDSANAQTIYEEPSPNIVQVNQISRQFAALPSKNEAYDVAIQAIEEKPQLTLRIQKIQASLPMAKMNDKSIDALEHVISFDASVQVAGAPKPVIKGKNLQVSSSSFTSVKPQRNDKILQISPASLENTLVQSTLEPIKETIVVPAPKVSTSNKECEAIIKLSSFDVEVQFSEVVPQKVVFDKNMQSSAPLLETTIVQSDFVEEVKIPVVPVEKASVVFAKPPSPPKVVTTDSSCEPIQPSQTFDAITQSSPVAFAEPVAKPQMFGKKLQVNLVPDLTEKLIQSTIESKLDAVTSQTVTITDKQPTMEDEFTQSDFVKPPEKPMMFGKKMQVDLRPSKQDDVAQTEPFVIEAPVIEKAPTIVQPVYSAPPTLNLDIMTIQTPKYTSILSYAQSSAQEQKSSYHEDGCDPLPILASDAFTQSEEMKQESPIPVVARHIALVQESAPLMKTQLHDVGCDPIPEVPKLGKKTLVTPPSLEVGQGQTVWVEVELAQVMSKRESNINKTTQSDAVVTYGKKLQVIPPPMEVRVCQTVPSIESSPLISAVEAPPVVEKVCEPMLKTPTSDFSVQMDTPATKPPNRSVRIQKGVGVFEGTRTIATQLATPEPRRSPLSPVLARTIGIEWGVQVEPVRMSGVTQTPDLEQPTIPIPKPSIYSKSTQAEFLFEPIKPISEPEAFVSAPIPPRSSENLFSFVRETKTRLTGRSRSGSSGLIPYKTQVNQSNNLSVSVPAMLNIKTDVTSPATITEGWGYSNRTASQVPRRYASRFRSTAKRGTYDRRNKSMENIYARGSRTLPRHFISDSDLTMENRWLQQQLEMEQRCEECIIQCVRLIGFDKVAQMVMDTRLPGDLSLFEDLESYQAKRRRLQNARTQYTSTAPLACPYCYDGGEGHINGRQEWQLGAGEEEFFNGDDRYEWDTMGSYGSSKRGTYKWVTRTPIMGHMQVEPTSEEVDQLMKSRALNAYCSDYELQQSGINANFEENAAFTFVAWKTNHEGDGKLEMDTVGHLLKLTMVGARVPGTGEVISAADAFYRGILRVIYMDDERGVILPLPVAINANAVIVEKRFSSGVGIAFQSSRKCPVECSAVWQTPNMRRRTYRVNYIRVSDSERIPVSRALNEGIIDKYSGEIVGVRAPSSLEIGNPLLQIRESSVGTGETMERKHRPERFNIREAILNDIINVDLIQPEVILLPDSEMDSVTPGDGRREEDGSVGSETNSDLEV